MDYEIKNFETVGDNKLVGFMVTNDNGKLLAIDKQIAIAEGKTDEQYVQEALAAAQAEIDDWNVSASVVGRKWNPDTNSFE